MKTLPGKEKQWTAMPWIAGAKPEETDKVAALKPPAFLLLLLWAGLGISSFCWFPPPHRDGDNFFKLVWKEGG